MTDWRPSHPRPSLGRRLRRRARDAVSIAVWAVAVAATIWLAGLQPSSARFHGIVNTHVTTIAAPAAGRLTTLLVDLHDPVEAGQVIARLDDRDVRLKLSQATYELERLRADMAKRSADLANEASTSQATHGLEASVEHRRLVSAAEVAQLEVLATRTRLEEARVRVQGVSIEADRLASLVSQGMLGEPDLVRTRTERDALHKRIDELEKLMTEQAARARTAQERVDSFAPGDLTTAPVEATLAPWRWRLKTQEATLERIALDAATLVLEAPAAGVVKAIRAQQGEWVRVGQPLVTLAAAGPTRVVGYIPSPDRPLVERTTAVVITRPDASTAGVGRIESISPTLVPVPERLWLDPRRQEWAYEIIVTPTGTAVPGERVGLTLTPP
ncbi:MAG: HlyD family efflux transporter periplasmic adaptor subunit [bacterium]|nr:HlyD family efflux transporter periplasmic adaptor subunit [bacterium]